MNLNESANVLENIKGHWISVAGVIGGWESLNMVVEILSHLSKPWHLFLEEP